MGRFAGFLLAILLFAPPDVLGDELPAVSADFGYASRYVFRGVERAGSSAQTRVDLTRENFSGGVWLNQPFANGQARETSLNAAYRWHPGDEIGLKLAAAHSWFSGVPGNEVKRSFETGVTASFPAINGFVPGLAWHHDFYFRADTAQASLTRSVPLTRWGTFLELNFFAGWTTGDDWRPDAPGPRKHDGYSYWGGEARVPYRIGPHSMVTAGLHYADSSGRSMANGPFGLAARRNLWVTLGVNLDF